MADFMVARVLYVPAPGDIEQQVSTYFPVLWVEQLLVALVLIAAHHHL
jgi:hypothetical protein